jgi:hypothetical protein
MVDMLIGIDNIDLLLCLSNIFIVRRTLWLK